MNGLIRYLTIHRDDPRTYSIISTASFVLNAAFTLLICLVIWGLEAWVGRSYQLPQLTGMLEVYLVTAVLMTFLIHFNFVQQANLEFRGIFWSSLFLRFPALCWAVMCLFTGQKIDLIGLVYWMLIGTGIGAVVSWLFARPYLRHAYSIDFEWIKKLFAFGKFGFGTNLSTMFYKNLDKLVLGQILWPMAFALYDVAGKVTTMVEAPSFSIAQVVFPQSTARMETEGKAGVKWLYERSVAAILAIILPLLLACLLFAEPIVLLLASKQYAESANLLRLTAFFGLFMPFAVQFGTVLDSTGRPGLNFIYTFFTAVLNLVLSYFLVKNIGLFGAAIATLIGYTISFFLMQQVLKREYGIRWQQVFRHLPDMYRMGWELIQEKIFKNRPDKKPQP
jgi:O-antigen/teichoic acid export membrane protein